MTQANQRTGQNAPAKSAGPGKAFFDRADQIVETGNWDYAIEMYLEGIRREPDNLHRGHQPLRNAALNRKAKGGKGPGLADRMKRGRAKEPIDQLINAEYLLAKEPGSVQYMERFLQAAKGLELKDVVVWIAQIMLEAQRQALQQDRQPNMKVLLLLVQTLHDVEEYGLGLQAADLAREQDPTNAELQEAAQELSAKYTIQKGKYDQEGDFTRSVVDLEKQKELAQSDMLSQGASFLQKQVARAQEAYEADPKTPGKIYAYVDALLKFEDDEHENRAIEVLQKAYDDLEQYSFKSRLGDVRMRQMTRRYRQLRDAGKTEAARQQARKQLAFELEEYAERAQNYPTDLGIKYELGRRQLLVGQYDDAIGSLQEAQRDPKRRVRALNLLGQAFAKKEWYREAGDTYRRALELEMPEDREKEIRYNLGDSLEKQGQRDAAQEQFSEVAQIDYNYKDVRQRLEMLREQAKAGLGDEDKPGEGQSDEPDAGEKPSDDGPAEGQT